MSVNITGIQINLRDWQSADVDLYAVWLQPGHRWLELDGPYYPGPDEAEREAMIGRLRERIQKNEWGKPRPALVIAGREDDRLLGRVSWYWQSKAAGPPWISLGIVIYDPAQWGRGLGYEALGLWCDYLWQAMPELARLDLRTWSGNRGMMRLAQKVGFVEEARFRQARWVNGRFYDSMGYGVLRTEWRARYPAGFAAHLNVP
jgi:RimJ/RimL family protein N-acetyltransferase